MHVDPEDVVVTLTPVHARHLAGALRLQLALRWETAELGPMPCREEVERARGLLDLYGEQLERLDWGEPAGEVSLRWRADAIRGLALELRQAAEECFSDSADKERRREILDTARALGTAVSDRGQPVAA
jgi:hypothetical protein